VPRLRVLHLAASFGAGALVVAALGTVAARAQTAPSDPADMLRPTPDGDQSHPPRFRPAERTAQSSGPSRFGEIPAFGSPPASAAGQTGFDSTNALKRKARALRRTSTATRVSATVAVAPLRMTSPVGAMRPAPQLERRGASLTPQASAYPISAGVAPPRRRPPADTEAFSPVGVRAGPFLLRPAVEVSAGFDSNPTRVTGGKSSSLMVIAPELQVRSDWQRHAVNADIRGGYIAYGRNFGTAGSSTPESLDRPNLDARLDGRLDITALSRFEGQGRLIVSTDNPGSPNIQAGLVRLPIVTTVGGTMGYAQRFNRFELTGKGSVDRSVYQQSELTDGSTASNDDRNFNQYAGAMRGSYELTPGVRPFVEAGIDTRVHDLAVDRSGTQRDSNGVTVRVGTTFEFSRKLTGEVSAGYLTRTYQDPTLPDLAGAIFDASLIWTASALTTATLTAKSTVDETIVAGVSGTLRRDVGVQVDHAFRRWLIGTVRLGYGMDDYVGSAREDQRYSASGLMTYKLSRTVQVKGELRRDWLKSSVEGADYTATAVLGGLRFQL
jgi:hypothetical protein